MPKTMTEGSATTASPARESVPSHTVPTEPPWLGSAVPAPVRDWPSAPDSTAAPRSAFPLPKTADDPRYARLKEIFTRAYNQAAAGKGERRHGQGLPFEHQPMQTISQALGSHIGLLYQAGKKAQESLRLERDAAVAELLGAINYLAGAVIYLEEHDNGQDDA